MPSLLSRLRPSDRAAHQGSGSAYVIDYGPWRAGISALQFLFAGYTWTASLIQAILAPLEPYIEALGLGQLLAIASMPIFVAVVFACTLLVVGGALAYAAVSLMRFIRRGEPRWFFGLEVLTELTNLKNVNTPQTRIRRDGLRYFCRNYQRIGGLDDVDHAKIRAALSAPDGRLSMRLSRKVVKLVYPNGDGNVELNGRIELTPSWVKPFHSRWSWPRGNWLPQRVQPARLQRAELIIIAERLAQFLPAHEVKWSDQNAESSVGSAIRAFSTLQDSTQPYRIAAEEADNVRQLVYLLSYTNMMLLSFVLGPLGSVLGVASGLAIYRTGMYLKSHHAHWFTMDRMMTPAFTTLIATSLIALSAWVLLMLTGFAVSGPITLLVLPVAGSAAGIGVLITLRKRPNADAVYLTRVNMVYFGISEEETEELRKVVQGQLNSTVGLAATFGAVYGAVVAVVIVLLVASLLVSIGTIVAVAPAELAFSCILGLLLGASVGGFGLGGLTRAGLRHDIVSTIKRETGKLRNEQKELLDHQQPVNEEEREFLLDHGFKPETRFALLVKQASVAVRDRISLAFFGLFIAVILGVILSSWMASMPVPFIAPLALHLMGVILAVLFSTITIPVATASPDIQAVFNAVSFHVRRGVSSLLTSLLSVLGIHQEAPTADVASPKGYVMPKMRPRPQGAFSFPSYRRNGGVGPTSPGSGSSDHRVVNDGHRGLQRRCGRTQRSTAQQPHYHQPRVISDMCR